MTPQKKAITMRKEQRQSIRPILDASRGEFYEAVADVTRTARSKAYRAIDSAMVDAYWNAGRMIVEEEQQGNKRAEYGAYLLRNLALRLTEKFGRGFDEREEIEREKAMIVRERGAKYGYR